MSIFDENRELTPEVFRQYKFHENEFKDGWIKIIVNRDLRLVIHLYFNEINNGYKVTGDADDHRFNVLKLKERYIDNTIDLDTFMYCIREMNFTNLFDYFELSV